MLDHLKQLFDHDCVDSSWLEKVAHPQHHMILI